MLKKLLKHEFIATSRIMLPLYIILVFFTALNKILLSNEYLKTGRIGSTIFAALAVSYVVYLLIVGIGSHIFLIVRFYTNLVTREGYLMFTLPVKTYNLINSKLIVTFVWTIFSTILPVLSAFFVFVPFDKYKSILDTAREYLKIALLTIETKDIPLVIICFIIMLVLSVVQKMLTFYLAISIGQIFSKNKIIASIIAYVALTTIMQVVSTFTMIIFSITNETSLNMLKQSPIFILSIINILSLIFVCLQYYFTNYCLSKKLNLE